MQTEMTFSASALRTKTSDGVKIFQGINPIKRFQQFIEKSDWDERLLGYEKYLNRFSWGIIIASAVCLIPVCITILAR
jgi:hypothetical protein